MSCWVFNEDQEPECPTCLFQPCWGKETRRDGKRVWFQCRRCHMDFWVES